jgi:hypothetical protein
MGDLGKIIKDQVRARLGEARTSGKATVASAANVGGEGHSTSVVSDGEVTVVTRDGKTEVIRHRAEDAGGETAPEPA